LRLFKFSFPGELPGAYSASSGIPAGALSPNKDPAPDRRPGRREPGGDLPEAAWVVPARPLRAASAPWVHRAAPGLAAATLADATPSPIPSHWQAVRSARAGYRRSSSICWCCGASGSACESVEPGSQAGQRRAPGPRASPFRNWSALRARDFCKETETELQTLAATTERCSGLTAARASMRCVCVLQWQLYLGALSYDPGTAT